MLLTVVDELRERAQREIYEDARDHPVSRAIWDLAEVMLAKDREARARHETALAKCYYDRWDAYQHAATIAERLEDQRAGRLVGSTASWVRSVLVTAIEDELVLATVLDALGLDEPAAA